jgi:hypothetical protein
MQIGFFGLLTIVFVALKLTDYISWSWWLVLLPAYGGLVILFVLFILLALFGQKPRININRKK